MFFMSNPKGIDEALPSPLAGEGGRDAKHRGGVRGPVYR
jgi:hypothetical protein